MRKFVLALFMSAMLAGFVSTAAIPTAAQAAPAACPTIRIDGPADNVSQGKRELLMATVSGGSPSIKPEIKWTSNGGKGEMGTSPTIAWLDTTGVPVGTKIL